MPEKDAPAAETSPKDGGASCIEGGCPCSENGQCESGYCLDDAGTGACAFKCAGGCPSGTSCKTVAAGADTVEVCMPKFPRICDPCQKDSDCQGGAAGTAALCVDYGDGQNSPGKFCGGACDDKSPCPVGYACAQVKNSAGALVKQCKREDLTCACSPRAVKLGLATSCSSSNAFGTCSGQRFCDGSGLSPCGAAPAKAELCDGADNDCDAQTDESACDDKNPCTTDACDPINKKCTNTPSTASCDDGSVCTSKDSCKEGVCTGTVKNCDDGEACTEDSCDSKTGCKNEVLTGPCATDNPCEAGAQCKDGICQGAKPKVCNDSNPCTADSCLDGKCLYKQLQVPCDDGNVCTTADVCETGTCLGKGKVCADNNPCTEDTCNPSVSGGCQFAPVGASCDDRNACTTKDFCVNGTCAGSDNKCSDGKPCTLDSCDPSKGCVNSPVSGACDDGNPCTASDTCNATTGACTPGTAAKCDDGNGCTTDACDPSKGCVYSPAIASCDDGDACTQGDACKDGKCTGGTNKCGCQSDTDCAGQGGNLCLGKLKCDKAALPYQCKPDPLSAIACNTASDTDCKKTTCDPANGQCVAKTVNESGLCSDGNACTIGDTCTQGVCKAQGNKSCEDNNACTDDSCVPTGTNGGCQFANNTAACNDGDACTKTDSCSGGQCKGLAGAGCCGVNSDCDDKNPCMVDTCDAKSGACKHDAVAANGQTCPGDGSGCTVGDVCQAGQCLPGKAADCTASADACNDAVCTSTGGTTYQCTKKAKANNTVCDDGKFCTTGEACQSGTCSGGKVLDCAASGCTTGVCDEAAKGCKGTPKTDGSTCDADGSGCTKDDQCVAGKCVAGVKVDCSNPFDICNDIACSSTGAVSYQCKPTPKAKGAPCEDGKFCTEGDGCDGAGKCLAGGPTDCSSATNACNDATCDEASKSCAPKAKADGAPCNDGDTCTATDTCKAGQCVGSNNACGDFKISMGKSVGVTAAIAKTPALVDMGAGRFRAAWGNTDSLVALRSYRGDWSREYTEQTYPTPFAKIVSVVLFPSGAAGINDLLTGATDADSGSCYTNYYNSCTTPNGCNTGSYADCGTGSCYKYRYNSKYDLSWQRYDTLDALSGGKTTFAATTNSCSKSDVSTAVLNSFVGAGGTDGKRLIAYNYAGTVTRRLISATGAAIKELGTENGAKNYDVAIGSDGTSIFVWDDGAEIWAQMYYSDGSTNGNKFQVNTKTLGVQSLPRVAYQPSGRYIVAWNTDQGAGDVAVQVFKPDPGSFLGQETTVNTTAGGIQAGARIGVSCVFAFNAAACATKGLPYVNAIDCGDTSLALAAAVGGVTWALDATPGVPGKLSGSCSLNFNNGTNYVPTGGLTPSGTATTAFVLDASPATKVVVAFLSYNGGDPNEGSNSYDIRYVEASVDGFKTVAWQKQLNQSVAKGAWVHEAFDASALAGKKFQLRFRFEGGDSTANAGPGWFIENVQVYAGNVLTPTATVPAVEPFAAGNANGWRLSAATNGVAWAIDAAPAAPGKLEGDASLNFNNGTNFNGGTVNGTALSPIIDLSAFAAGTKLSAVWRTWFDTETGGTFDQRYVEISSDGGQTFATTLQLLSNTGNKGWIFESLDLTAYAGKRIQLRFRFESIDGVSNDGTGWFVDALNVAAAPVPTFADGIVCSDTTKWTLANSQTGTVWAIDGLPAPPAFASGDCSLNFNNNTAFTCVTGGAKVAGTATSAAFTLAAAPAGLKAYVSYSVFLDTENGISFDLLKAEISDHGFATAANLSVLTPKTALGSWATYKVDVTALAAAGKPVQIRFWFDSVDCLGNSGKGVFVDDVRVEYGP